MSAPQFLPRCLNRAAVPRLRHQRWQTWHEAKALADTAFREDRAFSDEEQLAWEVSMSRMDHQDLKIQVALGLLGRCGHCVRCGQRPCPNCGACGCAS